MYEVIGFAAQCQMGKDVSADYVANRLGWNRGSFAKSVKQVFCETFDVPPSFVEEWKVRNELPPGFDMPCRQALQFIGDGFRKIKDQIWIELAFRRMTGNTIFSDVRYINELRKIRVEGGLNVLIYRPGYLNDDTNGSEAQIRPFLEYFDKLDIEGQVGKDHPGDMNLIDMFIRNDGSISQLYDKLDTYVVDFYRDFNGNT